MARKQQFYRGYRIVLKPGGRCVARAPGTNKSIHWPRTLDSVGQCKIQIDYRIGEIQRDPTWYMKCCRREVNTVLKHRRRRRK